MMAVPAPVRRLLHALGIDRAVAYSLMTQGWTFLVQPVTLVLIARYLSETQQGYYYTFLSIIAVQMYCELGLGIATLQFISHEAGHLQWTPTGMLDGEPAAKARLASMVRLSLRWYGAIAAVLVVVLVPVGWWFFEQNGEPGVSWRLPWVWTVLATAAGLPLLPFTLLLAGCGRVADQVRITGLQKVATNVVQWGALLAGAALLSWPVAQTAGVVLVAVWLARYWGPAVRELWTFPTEGLPRVNWWREVWPFQWRIAVGGPFGFLTTELFAPVLFATPAFGPEVAGQMGMSKAVMQVLFSAVHAWVGVRTPLFGRLIARREWATLDRTFRQVFVQSTLLAVFFAVLGWTILVLLRAGGYQLGSRVLSPLPLGLLLANAVVQHMSLSLAAYLRAHRRDPFFGLLVAFGLSVAAAVFTVGRWYGPVAMAASLLILNSIICLGGGALVFLRCRRAWHAEGAEPLSAEAVPAVPT
jgi:hypothetical protein